MRTMFCLPALVEADYNKIKSETGLGVLCQHFASLWDVVTQCRATKKSIELLKLLKLTLQRRIVGDLKGKFNERKSNLHFIYCINKMAFYR